MSKDNGAGLPRQLQSGNRLKLGTFGSNSERANAMTTIPGYLRAEWGETLWAAQKADEMGFEVIVPLSRWKGVGGETNFNGRTFDPITWAAGIAAATTNPLIFATVNTLFNDPIVAAKQLATLDHISGGRAALNIVAGWFRPEVEMFGKQLPDRDTRYDIATEWTEVVKRLWTAGEFEEVSFQGEHFQLVNGYSEPRPLQDPHPVIMNAGSSGRARDYTMQYADLAFIQPKDGSFENTRKEVQALKDHAASLGRDLRVWTFSYVVGRDTDAEAAEYLEWYSQKHGDRVAAENTLKIGAAETATLDLSAADYYINRLLAGSGIELLGSPDTIVERMASIVEMGFDGTLLSWPDWRNDVPYFQREILPRLERAGLRAPVAVR